MSKTPKFIFKRIELISKDRGINKVMVHLVGGAQTWDGKGKVKETTIIYKSDALWREIENFIKCCRESRGFWVR